MLRARRDEVALEHVHEPSAAGATAADVECREDLGEILGDLARLPDDQRAALVLAELGDLSHEEIAATLDVRKDKVKALIFQAREALAGRRQARAADCRDIQEQLATLRGSALRRAPIRQHVALCPTCAAFEREVARQREALALLLPVIPSAALKHSVLSAAIVRRKRRCRGGRGGRRGSRLRRRRGVAGAGASGLAVKTLAVAALAIGAGGGGVVAVRELDSAATSRHGRRRRRRRARQAAAAAPIAAPPAAGPARRRLRHRTGATRRRSHRRATRRAGALRTPRAERRRGKANGRGSQGAAKVNRGRLRAAAQRQAARPAPATSRRPKAAKTPPAKGKATAPAAAAKAHPGKATAPGQTHESPVRGRQARRRPSSQALSSQPSARRRV